MRTFGSLPGLACCNLRPMRTSQRHRDGGRRLAEPQPTRQVELKSRPLSEFRPQVELVRSQFPTIAEFHRHDRRTRSSETEDSLGFVCGWQRQADGSSSGSTACLSTLQPFTRAEAIAAGLTDVDLRSRRFQRLFHGLYVRSGSKIGVHQMAAAALHISPPGSYASHETAAALWGASAGELNEVHVSVPKGSSRSERRGIVAHRATGDQNPRPYRGLLISEPTCVFLQLAATRTDLVDLVALAIHSYDGNGLRQGNWLTWLMAMRARALDLPAEPRRTSGPGLTRRGSRDYGCSSCWAGCQSREPITSFVN